MRFELSEALVEDILFFMEDQSGEFFLDTVDGIVIGAEDEEFEEEAEEGRYLSLPEWGPSDGYRLMEHFTAALRNPPAREELSDALGRGRGVFRSFKDAIARHPETEKRWFAFKEREMKREVIRWYNALRESWGMELIGSEPEDTECLVLEDFRFREGDEADREAAGELHRLLAEADRGGSPGVFAPAAEMLDEMNGRVFPGDLCIAAETAGGEFAAYISAVFTSPARLHIHALEVRPEYRGLGLGSALLARLLEKADGAQVSRVSVDLPCGMEHFSRALTRESFKPCVQRYCRSEVVDGLNRRLSP
ncbi:MAG: GNAT family N-acetyltransferase [Treponema sp.]|jgi:GNAT superfamily N-acetyltransferase|nr:GNAT family N-acetyltransferase [Treponema sp.]